MKMNLARFFCSALATFVLLSIGAVTARAGGINVSTGLDASNVVQYVGGTPDAHWTVSQFAGSIGVPQVVAPGNADGAFPIWAANGPTSSWITINPFSSTGNGSPLPTYYRTFNLTAAQAATASISGVWGIDDSGEVRLNSNLLSSVLNDYSASTPFSAGSSDFVVGLNVLTITMTSSDNFLEAVRLQGTVTYAPEPASMTLLGVGIASMAGYGWRRRRLAEA